MRGTRSLSQLCGTYALAIVSADEPDRIVVARSSSPLVIGLGEGATFCASDVPALLAYTRSMIFLEDGDVAVLERGGAVVTGRDGQVVKREVRELEWSPLMTQKGGFKHFMLKEIYEQPRALEDTLRGRLDLERADVAADAFPLDESVIDAIQRVVLIGCGTSHHAGLVGRHFLEKLARIACSVEISSELRGRDAVLGPSDLVVAVSQSGETLDTRGRRSEWRRRSASPLKSWRS